jgi:hypothetical protein
MAELVSLEKRTSQRNLLYRFRQAMYTNLAWGMYTQSRMYMLAIRYCNHNERLTALCYPASTYHQ